MSSIKSRLLTAIIGIPAILMILILSEKFPWLMYIAIAIVTTIMVFEVLSARRIDSNFLILIPCMVYAFVEPLLASTRFMLIPVYLLAVFLFFVMIINSDKIRLTTILYAFTCTCMITFGMSSILMLSAYLNGFISFSFVVVVGVAWVADAGAYFAGVSLGKRKLCPKISPNKTVEGFIGGLIVGTIGAVLIGVIYSFIYIDASFNFFALILIGLFGSLVSVLGDLTFSLIKRYCGIKDYGSLFPGHGGMLDRFDSVIFISPLVYLICTVVPLVFT